MTIKPSKKIIVLGMITRHPVAGMIWLTVQYLLGFQRLGYDVYYVEPQGSSAESAAWLERVMRQFGLEHRWAYDIIHDEPRCYGMSKTSLTELYREAAWIFNLHGSTKPTPELYATGRLVYIGTDPVEIEINLWDGEDWATKYLEPHCAFFTWGENLGRPGCRVPVPRDFHFKPTHQPAILDMWDSEGGPSSDAMTTIGNWAQPYRTVEFQGETYHWSKHYEFLKFLDLPRRTAQPFELALSSYKPEDRRMLEENGWRITEASRLGDNAFAYRDYILGSRGEFTVAKDQYVRMKTGWLSDRSVCYLAAGRPVINQDSGFACAFPTGEGLFAFSTMEDILTAVDKINSDYARHARAASELARTYLSYEVVLGNMLAELGETRR